MILSCIDVWLIAQCMSNVVRLFSPGYMWIEWLEFALNVVRWHMYRTSLLLTIIGLRVSSLELIISKWQPACSMWDVGTFVIHAPIYINSLFGAQGKHNEAEALYRRSLAMEEKILGPEHPGVAIARNNLANVLRVKVKPSVTGCIYMLHTTEWPSSGPWGGTVIIYE